MAAAALAAGANGVLWPEFGLRYPLIAFYPAITLSAWYGGFWPGMVCTTLSSTIAAFVWFDPRFSTRISNGADSIGLLVFFGVGVVISALSESLLRKGQRERTARHRAEAAEEHLVAELAEMQRLQTLNDALLKAEDLSHLLREVLDASIELLHADAGHVDLCDDVEDCANIVAHVGISDQFVDAVRMARGGDSVPAKAVRRRERIIVEDAACDLPGRPLAAAYASSHIVGVQSTPLMGRNGKPLGVLSTSFRRPRRLTNRELRFLDLYAHQAGRAIERSRLSEAERSAREEAERANRLKDQFLWTVSHELRTPLNAILGWSDMLRSGHLAESRRGRAVQAVCDNAKRQARLIDDLLDVSRIATGKLRLDRAAVDFRALIQSAIDVVEPTARAKGVDLVVTHDPRVTPSYGDAARLQQVFWNLLSNAIKFTPTGGVVQVDAHQRGNVAEIIIRDTGAGIAGDFLPFVFDAFRQADASTTRSHGGLGLGLSIVKHLVEAHGGSVHADSDGEGMGAVFTVQLPVVTARVDPPETQSADRSLNALLSAPTLLHGISVLVVDDDADSREVVSVTLEEAGAVVIIATSAAEALDLLPRHPIDLILADIAMPGEDGYSLIRRVRALKSSGLSRIPAVALTSLVRDEDHRDAMNAGFQGHVPKPVDLPSLPHLVATLMNRVEA